MKAMLLFISLAWVASSSSAQGPFSESEALKQLYRKYNANNGTAQWVCTNEQKSTGMHRGWPCSENGSAVSITVLLVAEVKEGNATKVYLVTSAKPLKDALDQYDCHACAPAIGAAVFIRQRGQWTLESGNAAVGFYGGWGGPPLVDFLSVGPEKHGIVLSTDDMSQGYAFSAKFLIMPVGETVAETWSIQDENDNLAAIDPDDKLNKQLPYKASSAFRFFAADEDANSTHEYYQIEVISRGEDRQDFNHPIRPENWTEIYRFRNDKYKLVQHRDFNEPEAR